MESITPQWIMDIFEESNAERERINGLAQTWIDSEETDEVKKVELDKLREELEDLEHSTMKKINPDYNMKELNENYNHWKQLVVESEEDITNRDAQLQTIRGQIIDLRQTMQKIINPRWNDVPQEWLDEMKTLRLIEMPIDEEMQEVFHINREKYSQADRDRVHNKWIKIKYEVDQVWTKKIAPIVSGNNIT